MHSGPQPLLFVLIFESCIQGSGVIMFKKLLVAEHKSRWELVYSSTETAFAFHVVIWHSIQAALFTEPTADFHSFIYLWANTKACIIIPNKSRAMNHIQQHVGKSVPKSTANSVNLTYYNTQLTIPLQHDTKEQNREWNAATQEQRSNKRS